MTVTNVQAKTQPGTAYYQFTTPRDPKEGMSPIFRWLAYSFSYTDQTASVVAIDLPLRCRMIDFRLEIVTAWTSTTAVTAGDGSAADGWLATGVVDPTTADDFGGDYDATYRVKGKKYTTGDTIDVSFAGIATAGTAIAYIGVISYEE